MRKVLVITYYWPPSGGSGVQRWLKLVKYLRDFGWEPIVYTPENPEYPALDESLLKDIPQGIEIIRQPIWEPYSYYKRLVGMKRGDKINAGFLTEKKKIGFTEKLSVWLRGNLFIPDARKFWIKPSIRFLTSYLREKPVDAVISTGPPHSMHMIAMGIRESTGIPWIADFCDPWTSIDFYDQLRLTKAADKQHHFLEQQVLRRADAVIAVTRTMAEEFNELHSRKYEVVTNGFDEADIQPIHAEELDKKFSISHIGSIVPSRNPHYLWQVLAQMADEISGFASQLEIKLVGKVDISVIESIKQAGLSGFLKKIDYLPHDKALRETQKSQVLLLLINKTPNANGILTGKLFEYLAAQRPILCIGPADGDASLILEETMTGKVCEFEDPESLRLVISEFYQQFLRKQLFLSNKELDKYSWRYLANEVAQNLNILISPRNSK